MAFNGKFLLQWRNFGLKLGATLKQAPDWAKASDEKWLDQSYSREDFHNLLTWIRLSKPELPLGLSFGATLRFNLAGMVGSLVQSSPDLKTALEVMAQFYQLGCPEIKIELQKDEGLTLILRADSTWQKQFPEDVATLQETLLVFCHRFLKELNEKFKGFSRLSLDYNFIGDQSLYEKAFNIKVAVQNLTSFSLSQNDLSLPIISRDPQSYRELYALCNRLSKSMLDQTTWSDKVKEQIRMTLPGNKGSLKEIAFAMAMTDRTLQRRLKDEKTDFRTCQRELWQEVYQELKLKEISEKEIAEFLGFQSPINMKIALNSKK